MMRQHKDKVWYNLGFKYQRLGYSKKQKQIYVLSMIKQSRSVFLFCVLKLRLPNVVLFII